MSSEEIRSRSKAVLGSRYRMEVAARIDEAEGGVVSVRDLADALGVRDNLIQIEIKHFEAAELLIRLPRVAGQQVQYYQPVDSVYWQMCRRLRDETATKSARAGRHSEDRR